MSPSAPAHDLRTRGREPYPVQGRRPWIEHWLDTNRDLQALAAAHPMMDAVIDEVDGRMIRIGDQWLADFASCNYLGFDLDREIIDAVPAYLDAWGTHPSWSRLLGSPVLYEQIEERLTALLGSPDSLVLPTITHIHMSVIPLLAASGTIFLDSRAHKTIYDGCQVARARGAAVKRFRFEDPDHLDQLLRAERDPTRLICMDGVNSMTGNAPDIRAFAAVARRHGALLYVDDAHGFGVIGERSPDETSVYGVRGNSVIRHCDESYDDVVLVGGFSKAYSSLLAFIACPTDVKNLLKVAAPPYLYSGPSPVASLATVLAGFDVNEKRGDALRQVLFARTKRVLDCLARLGVHTPNHSGFPIIEIPLRDHLRIDAVGRLLFDRGVYVTLAAYPLVPRDEVGFRVQLTAANTDAEVDTLISALEELADAGELQTTSGTLTFADPAGKAEMSGRAALARLRALPVWKLYLCAGTLVCGLYLFVPPFAGSSPVMNVIGLSPVIAILAGLRLHRPESRGPWRWFALGFLLFWLGDIYTYSYPRLVGHEVPFPSIGDASYVLVYPALMAGLLMLVRRRNPARDRAGAIDSLIMTLGLALISWLVLIQPSIHADELSLIAKLTSIAYPLGDIALLAAAIRLAVDTGTRRPAFFLLAAGILALLGTDAIYGVMTLQAGYHGQVWLDVGWISFYLLWGAAALHPSMRELDRPADREPRLSASRLALLTCASLIAPVIALMQTLDHARDRGVVNVAAIVLFGLVVARMAGLVRQQERSVQRERILSAAGADLVAATSREAICHAALGAARALAGAESDARLCLIERDRVVVAAPGSADWTLPSLPPDVAGHREALRLPEGILEIVELTVRGERQGVLVTTVEESSRAVVNSLEALATEVSLALESAALTEEVHRRAGEARFASLVQHVSDLITVLDRDGTIIYQSSSIERVLGYTTEDVVGTPFDQLLQPGEEGRLPHLLANRTAAVSAVPQVFECALRHRDGNIRRFEMLYTDLLDDENVQGIVLNGRDVSERKAFEEQLAHQAFHDPVTHLANRALFVERVRHAVARAQRERTTLAVLFMDLDEFKMVNDSLGHAAGDAVLHAVAQRLDGSIRASDTAARFGGDEFAVLLEDVGTVQEAADTAERILASLSPPIVIDGKQIFVGSSLGLSVVDCESTADADELIRNADAAMYIAKRDGKGGYRLFAPEMHEEVLERLELRADLQRAMAAGELDLYYQPIVRLSDGGVTGVEALLRWRHPQRGLVPPDQFVPLAEEIGLIVPIGRWVLREACRQARQMQSLIVTEAPLTVAVNLSVLQLQHSDIVADVSDALAESGLAAGCLTLEITETVMMTDTDTALARLEDLKGLGVRLAMDDFGKGYSSLSYLSQLPVDIVKMDRSFLSAGASPRASALASVVVGLGETLQLDVVAEGIEYDEQWTALRDLGCDLGQGFLFARPMDFQGTLEYLRSAAGSGAAQIA